MRAIAAARGGRCLSAEYVTDTALEWECAEGHRWFASAGNVKKGTWCRQCYDERRSNTISAMRALAASHGGECLSQAYENQSQPLRWRCANGHEWTSRHREAALVPPVLSRANPAGDREDARGRGCSWWTMPVGRVRLGYAPVAMGVTAGPCVVNEAAGRAQMILVSAARASGRAARGQRGYARYGGARARSDASGERRHARSQHP